MVRQIGPQVLGQSAPPRGKIVLLFLPGRAADQIRTRRVVPQRGDGGGETRRLLLVPEFGGLQSRQKVRRALRRRQTALDLLDGERQFELREHPARIQLRLEGILGARLLGPRAPHEAVDGAGIERGGPSALLGPLRRALQAVGEALGVHERRPGDLEMASIGNQAREDAGARRGIPRRGGVEHRIALPGAAEPQGEAFSGAHLLHLKAAEHRGAHALVGRALLGREAAAARGEEEIDARPPAGIAVGEEGVIVEQLAVLGGDIPALAGERGRGRGPEGVHGFSPHKAAQPFEERRGARRQRHRFSSHHGPARAPPAGPGFSTRIPAPPRRRRECARAARRRNGPPPKECNRRRRPRARRARGPRRGSPAASRASTR
ncbi:MAG: hypothetical protein BWX69_00446 [Planctomycetes bacterium ADurb.Bin069]|nr:MAG: hypothetical protein BWX69_00446 [Planctomycetes bacterium ADurb.Bin069]